jgi:hypothetical protein
MLIQIIWFALATITFILGLSAVVIYTYAKITGQQKTFNGLLDSLRNQTFIFALLVALLEAAIRAHGQWGI